MVIFRAPTFGSLRTVVLTVVQYRPFSIQYTSWLRASTFSMQNARDINVIPVHRVALNHLDRVAINDSNGSHTYMEVLLKAIRLSKLIKDHIGQEKKQERIGFLCSNDVTYVISQWACWAAGHIGMIFKKFNPNFSKI